MDMRCRIIPSWKRFPDYLDSFYLLILLYFPHYLWLADCPYRANLLYFGWLIYYLMAVPHLRQQMQSEQSFFLLLSFIFPFQSIQCLCNQSQGTQQLFVFLTAFFQMFQFFINLCHLISQCFIDSWVPLYHNFPIS